MNGRLMHHIRNEAIDLNAFRENPILAGTRCCRTRNKLEFKNRF